MQDSSGSTNNTVLEVDNVQINYETRKGDVEAIQGVSFTVREGETVGLVGESGCGKSTIAFGIVNFLGPNGKIVEGSIRFQGDELVGRSEEELKKLRGGQNLHGISGSHAGVESIGTTRRTTGRGFDLPPGYLA